MRVILDERRIRRLPVVEGGSLVGIISRGDLIKALASAPAGAGAGRPSDDELVSEIRHRIGREVWASNQGIVIQAKDGVLSLWGVVDTGAERSALETMARAIDGVKGIDSHLVVRSDVPYLYWI